MPNPARLIFNVREEIVKRSLSIVLPLMLTGCGTLPSKETAARIYEREHRDRHVVRVEQRQEGEDLQMKTFFDVTYTRVADAAPKKDILQYHRVAEGWVRSPP